MYIKKTLHCLALIFILSIFLNYQVSANENGIQGEFDIAIQIDKNQRLSATYTINLKNNEEKNLLKNYEVAIPYSDLYDLKVTDTINEIKHTIWENNGNTLISMDFETSAIRPNSTKKVSISFKVNKVISSYGENYLQFYYPQAKISHDIVSYDISVGFAKEYGDPVINGTESTYRDDSITLLKNKPIYLVWAENPTLHISTAFEVVNNESAPEEFTYQLPVSSDTQMIRYYSRDFANYGWKNSVGNDFAVVSLNSGEEKNITLQYQIRKLSGVLNLENVTYNWELNDSGDKSKKLLKILNSQDSKAKKMVAASKFIVENYTANVETKISRSVLDDMDILESESLNRVESAIVLSWIANYLNLENNIKFGYIVSNDIVNFQTDQPTVWLSVDLEQEGGVRIFDTYLSDVSGLSLIDLDADVDRIDYGVFDQSDSFVNLLGLLDAQDYVSKGIFTDEKDLPEFEDSNVTLSAVFPKEVQSGFPFSVTLEIFNNTGKSYEVRSISANLQSWNYSDGDVMPVLLPGKNYITIDDVREPYFFYDGERDYTFEVEFKDEGEVLTTQANAKIYMSPAQSFWIGAFVVINSLLVFCLYLLFRNRRNLQLLLTMK